MPVYARDEYGEGDWPEGGASRWRLLHSLFALEQSLAKRGLRLILQLGSAVDQLADVAREVGAGRMYWNFRYEPLPRRSRLKAWQRGQTGDPIVDAGMRELWATGWLPNRVRMIAASPNQYGPSSQITEAHPQRSRNTPCRPEFVV